MDPYSLFSPLPPPSLCGRVHLVESVEKGVEKSYGGKDGTVESPFKPSPVRTPSSTVRRKTLGEAKTLQMEKPDSGGYQMGRGTESSRSIPSSTYSPPSSLSASLDGLMLDGIDHPSTSKKQIPPERRTVQPIPMPSPSPNSVPSSELGGGSGGWGMDFSSTSASSPYSSRIPGARTQVGESLERMESGQERRLRRLREKRLERQRREDDNVLHDSSHVTALSPSELRKMRVEARLLYEEHGTPLVARMGRVSSSYRRRRTPKREGVDGVAGGDQEDEEGLFMGKNLKGSSSTVSPSEKTMDVLLEISGRKKGKSVLSPNVVCGKRKGGTSLTPRSTSAQRMRASEIQKKTKTREMREKKEQARQWAVRNGVRGIYARPVPEFIKQRRKEHPTIPKVQESPRLPWFGKETPIRKFKSPMKSLGQTPLSSRSISRGRNRRRSPRWWKEESPTVSPPQPKVVSLHLDELETERWRMQFAEYLSEPKEIPVGNSGEKAHVDLHTTETVVSKPIGDAESVQSSFERREKEEAHGVDENESEIVVNVDEEEKVVPMVDDAPTKQEGKGLFDQRDPVNVKVLETPKKGS
eukprot:TRINITY_DN621_c0_g1_i4.p1 TRINITY_DN621_c0_g1~~TRINITY_DN621_c0_g1_i4.p1  ORF type:complete len:583 (-),score=174.82 TRINITY_DN621_c0_g1_i4:1611-3359(-)